MDIDNREDQELIEVRSEQSSRAGSIKCSALIPNSKLSKPNNEDELLAAVLNNDCEAIHDIVNNIPVEVLHHRYRTYNRQTILVIACVDRRVSDKTLKVIYLSIKVKYGVLDFTDSEWFQWEPIHYAAKIADPVKLAALVEHMDDINNLTAFSENALHILLSRAVQPFQVVLCNGTESRAFSIISEERDNIVRCAEILLQKDIDLNHTNFWYEAPICLAARYRFSKTIELLLRNPYIEIDTIKESGKDITEYLKQNNIWVHSLSDIQNFYHNDQVKLLFDFLKAEDEDSFLTYNNENIRDYANAFDNSSGKGTCGTMLQFCFKKGFMEYLQSEAYGDKLTKHNINETPMLKVFLAKGMKRCIVHLLDNSADPNLVDNKCPEPILEAAAVRGYYPLVAILLERKNSDADIFHILTKMFDQPFHLNNHHIYRNYVIYLLLNKLLEMHEKTRLTGKKLRVSDELLSHFNLELDENKPDESDIICQILSLGASLMYKDENNKIVIERIHPTILRAHFDECIDNNVYCYNSIIEDSNNDYSETKSLQYLLRDRNKKILLTHPFISHFIHNKWLRIAWFFYVDLVFYFGYLISIWVYMVCLNDNVSIKYVDYILYIFLGLHVLKETVQLVFLYHFKYFTDPSNYWEFCIMLLCLVTICIPNIYTMVLSTLFSTVVFFLMLGQLPVFTKYTIIFGSTRYFLQYVGFYFFQFVSFAICFYMVFPFERNEGEEKSMLGDLFKSLFYSLIIFTGEFNDRVLSPTKYPIFGRLLTTLFCFCMTIILNNLLVGLIVSDINTIQEEAKFKKQVKSAEFVVRTSSLVKRLKRFRSLDITKKAINHIQLFKKGTQKVLDLKDCHHTHVMDEEDVKYLKDLKTRRHLIFDGDTLWNLYNYIEKYDNEQDKLRFRK